MLLREWQGQLSQALLLSEAPPLCELPALHGIEGRRLALYEELLFNTLLETLQSIYPYTYQLLSQNGEAEEDWNTLVAQYRRAYPNPSHTLLGAVSAFPEFLSGQPARMKPHPFLADLARYEWLDMEILNWPDVPVVLDEPVAIPAVDVWERYRPVWNPARRLVHFQFDVPTILECLNTDPAWPNGQPVQAKPVDMLIYRDPRTLDARFFCINPLTALLMQLTTEEDTSYASAVAQLQSRVPSLQTMPMGVLAAQVAQLFANCLETGMLLGSACLSSIQ